MKRKTITRLILTTAVICIAYVGVFAQGEATSSDELSRAMTTVLFVMAGVVIGGAIYGMFRFTELLSKNIENNITGDQGTSTVAAAVASKPSFWSQLNDKLTNRVPMEQEEDIMLDHDYDGIRELDNRLPPWWVGMFYVTIALGVVHILVYWVFGLQPLAKERYENQMAKAELQKQEYLLKAAGAVNENNIVALADNVSLEMGQSIFENNCVACHGALGEGGVGPNLTDKYWVHGGDIKDVFKTIKYGVPQKGMIAWQTQLSPVQMQQVTSYIATLVGTNPPGAKEPEGEEYIAAQE